METVNSIVLVGIFLTSLINLMFEVHVDKSKRHVISAKLIFATMAIGAIFAVTHPHVRYFLIMNASLLTALTFRIIKRIKEQTNKYKKHDNNIDIR